MTGQSNKLRYGRPISEPGSPTTSRSSTPRLTSDIDDDETDTSEEDEDDEVHRINRSASEKSLNSSPGNSLANQFLPVQKPEITQQQQQQKQQLPVGTSTKNIETHLQSLNLKSSETK